MKLGIVAFANHSGLGNQTRRLSYMLKPDRLLVIDSTPFSKNKKQNFQWYDGFSGYTVSGFPNNNEVRVFLKGLTHVLICENPLNFSMLSEARRLGIKTYIQSNYEFCDHLHRRDILPPDKFLMPSYWKIAEMENQFSGRVIHLPPPTDPEEFKRARDVNFSRKQENGIKLLHIVGTLAAHDRNGTLDLLHSLKFTKADFTFTIKSQHELPKDYIIDDSRIRYDMSDVQDTNDLYQDFDALILPRRYGGLALTCNEALMSGLPVFMTGISPNKELLPEEWLFKSFKNGSFMARTNIDVFSTDPVNIANKINWFINQNIDYMKIQAFELGYNNFSPTVLKPQYEELWKTN